MPLSPTLTAAYNTGQGNAVVTLVTSIDSKGHLVTKDFNIWITSYSTSVQTQFSSGQVQQGIVWAPVRRSEQMVQFTVDWPLQTKLNGQGYDYNGFRAMNNFHNALRTHQRISAQTTSSPPPMNFLYYNNFSGTYTSTDGTYSVTIANSSATNNPIVDNNLSSIPNFNKDGTPVKNPDGTYAATNPTNNSLTLQPIQYQGWIQNVAKEYDRFKAVYSEMYMMNVLTPSSDQNAIASSICFVGSNNELIPTSNTVISQGQNWTSANISMGDGINISKIPG